MRADVLRRQVARRQTLWLRIFVLSVLVGTFAPLPGPVTLPVTLASLALSFVRPPRRPVSPLNLVAPLRGRWIALNSPGSKVPSHGVHAYGQTYAIDVLHPRPTGEPPRPGWGLRQPAPEQFSSFGEPVLAAADGIVVRGVDAQRDHRARVTWPGLAYLLVVEGLVRELGGARWMLGNHLVVDHGDGTFSVYAHLRQGSLAVDPRDRVRAGQHLADVGSSGNASEPHLHFQVMDRDCPTAAAGLPWRWTDIDVEPTDAASTGKSPRAHRGGTAVIDDVPRNGQVFSVQT